ncbi:MAG: DUF1934 domain-containing protein [Clostridia bacterium]|nr:DUF1934 domain-containing protein [Clostridia bacterium]
MTVIKEVKIKIESVIENLDSSGLVDGEAERNVNECEGFLRYSDGEAVITYSESGESGSVTSEIKYKDGEATVKRSGAIDSELYFKEGVTHRSIYSVVPYKFDAEVHTRRIRASLGECGGTLDLFYNMKIGGADKSARMKIWIQAN